MGPSVIWDERPSKNVEHIRGNGLTPKEVEDVLLDDSLRAGVSRSSNRPCKFGYTSTGKYIIVVWDVLCDDPEMVYPITAYEVSEP